MYEGFELCPNLEAKHICIVVREYNAGEFVRRFHQHIPAHRISEEALGQLLKVLVLKFQNNEPLTIVRSFLNKRGREPSVYRLMWNAAYPEPGVLRKYCGTDTCAWADQVILPSNFRPKANQSSN